MSDTTGAQCDHGPSHGVSELAPPRRAHLERSSAHVRTNARPVRARSIFLVQQPSRPLTRGLLLCFLCVTPEQAVASCIGCTRSSPPPRLSPPCLNFSGREVSATLCTELCTESQRHASPPQPDAAPFHVAARRGPRFSAHVLVVLVGSLRKQSSRVTRSVRAARRFVRSCLRTGRRWALNLVLHRRRRKLRFLNGDELPRSLEKRRDRAAAAAGTAHVVERAGPQNPACTTVHSRSARSVETVTNLFNQIALTSRGFLFKALLVVFRAFRQILWGPSVWVASRTLAAARKVGNVLQTLKRFKRVRRVCLRIIHWIKASMRRGFINVTWWLHSLIVIIIICRLALRRTRTPLMTTCRLKQTYFKTLDDEATPDDVMKKPLRQCELCDSTFVVGS